ncbi:toxin-antitoxin system YwqK family antitoxin [Pyxidicoccus xibeiensis]|uniref:toxin-antitoxin system YwqK family antitoxin n=1 Tax=Pyxidicoccus xibeiensis TaxID=2906759 RepID=UPI0020A6E50E|nr:hypothetical protein [Pyxidicoccus xibeiensis]MCP3136832.1 hypothetical protein [Pyxidicoccus xibeiensis]
MKPTAHHWMLTALFVSSWSPAALAQAASTGGPTRMQELDAAIVELKASQAEAPANMKDGVARQVTALENSKKLQQMVDDANAQTKAHRPALTEEQKSFFTPVAPEKLPVWIPDTLTRAQAKEDMLKCPAGAKVFADAHALDCRIPGPRGSIPMPHGLALWFYKSTGKLKGQRFYENGLLRWAIAYHHTGGRDTEGRYDDAKPKQHREHGLHTGYAPNGTVIRQAEYTSGVLQGWSRVWEDDGYPMGATRYEKGKNVERRGHGTGNP